MEMSQEPSAMKVTDEVFFFYAEVPIWHFLKMAKETVWPYVYVYY